VGLGAPGLCRGAWAAARPGLVSAVEPFRVVEVGPCHRSRPLRPRRRYRPARHDSAQCAARPSPSFRSVLHLESRVCMCVCVCCVCVHELLFVVCACNQRPAGPVLTRHKARARVRAHVYARRDAGMRLALVQARASGDRTTTRHRGCMLDHMLDYTSLRSTIRPQSSPPSAPLIWPGGACVPGSMHVRVRVRPGLCHGRPFSSLMPPPAAADARIAFPRCGPGGDPFAGRPFVACATAAPGA
jgi:hypothetical protein